MCNQSCEGIKARQNLILFHDWYELNSRKCLCRLQQCISRLQVVNPHMQHATVWPDQLHDVMSQKLEKESAFHYSAWNRNRSLCSHIFPFTFHYSAWNSNRSLCSHLHPFLLHRLWWDWLGHSLSGFIPSIFQKLFPFTWKRELLIQIVDASFIVILISVFARMLMVITIVDKNDMEYLTGKRFKTIDESSGPHMKSTSCW